MFECIFGFFWTMMMLAVFAFFMIGIPLLVIMLIFKFFKWIFS